MSINPYAAPEATSQSSSEDWTGEPRDCWRDEDLLVAAFGAELPPSCFMCNRTADRRIEHRFAVRFEFSARRFATMFVIGILLLIPIGMIMYHWPKGWSPWLGLVPLLVTVFSLAVAAAHRDQKQRRQLASPHIMSLQMPMCSRHRTIRTVTSGIGLLFLVVPILNYFEIGHPLVVGIFPWVIMLLMIAQRLPTAKRRTDNHFWIRGCCKDYLAQLPRWEESEGERIPC